MLLPTFEEESKLWKQGYDLVIGVDEVGRGCFAGPVVAAAVVFSSTQQAILGVQPLKINDSKLVKPNERKRLAKLIKTYALAYGIGEVSVSIINKVGIGKATELAMRQAAYSLLHVAYSKRNDMRLAISDKPFILVDAFYVPYVKGIPKVCQRAITKGDQKSISIAAASIVAKVYRDSLMQRLSKQHPSYQWGRNKGYGTVDHQEAIKKNGITNLHRIMFVETFLAHSAIV